MLLLAHPLQQGAPCHTLLYSPANDPWVDRLIADVAAANHPPIPPGQVRAFANASEVRGRWSQLKLNCLMGLLRGRNGAAAIAARCWLGLS